MIIFRILLSPIIGVAAVAALIVMGIGSIVISVSRDIWEWVRYGV